MHDFLEEQESRRRQRSYTWPLWLSPALLVLAFIAFALMVRSAHSEPPKGVKLDPQLSAWFKAQKQEDNLPAPCCGTLEEEGGDGHYVNVRHEQGKWYVYVRELQSWEVYPRAVDPDLDNPTGRNVAWYKVWGDGSIQWYCLRISVGA